MNEIEFEKSLAGIEPAACSIDSMDLMFKAGVEHEKRNTLKLKRTILTVSTLAIVMFVSAISLLVWNFQLTKTNTSLVAKQQVMDRSGNKSSTDNQKASSENQVLQTELVAAGITDDKVAESVAESMTNVMTRIKSRVSQTEALALGFH